MLKQHGAGQASLLALAGCVGLLLTAMTVLTPVMTFLRRLASLAGVNPALLAPVLKAAAVGLLTQLTESFCKDAGQQALAKRWSWAAGYWRSMRCCRWRAAWRSYCSGWREADDAEVPDISAAGGSACNRRMRSGGCFAGGGRKILGADKLRTPFPRSRRKHWMGSRRWNRGAFSDGFKQILAGAVKGLGGWMRQGAQVSAALLAAALLCGFGAEAKGGAGAAVPDGGLSRHCGGLYVGAVWDDRAGTGDAGWTRELFGAAAAGALLGTDGVRRCDKRRCALRRSDAADQRIDEPDPIIPHSVRLLLFLSGRGAVCHRGRPAGMSARAGGVDG